MNEVIQNVLSDETYKTNEERVEAIKQGLATLVIPKDKFNDVNERLKSTESELKTVKGELDSRKKSEMTNEELAKEELKKVNAKSNKMMVENLLLKGGLTSEDYSDEDLELLSVGDEETNAKLANLFLTSMKKSAEKAKQDVTVELLKNTPKPEVGNPNGVTVSTVDSLKQQLDEAIKNKDVVLQAQLYEKLSLENSKMNVQ